jgi:F1F0 ATPase subunit 2
MSTATALIAGACLGLAHLAGLWLTVRLCLRRGARGLLPSQVVRLALCGGVLAALCREGIAVGLAALAGFWLARTCLLVCLGGIRHG